MLQNSSGNTASTPTRMFKDPSKKSKNKASVFVNFLAGGIGGTTGVFITCPLDVVQTRLQSSLVKLSFSTSSTNTTSGSAFLPKRPMLGLHVFSYMGYIVKTEGFFSLYKGLLPNLMGVAPSRAIYFGVYTKAKSVLSSTSLANSSGTHMLSALSASWCVSTITNPLWFMKTRLQLDLTATGQRRKILEVVRDVYKNEGVKGFYRGLSASYIGASETMIYFVIYEKLKIIVEDRKQEDLTAIDFVMSAFLSKLCATTSVYPHEVVRTRLRQETLTGKSKIYNSFFQTLKKVYREERLPGLYGGMGAHLMRQVPNTVIMFLTYETIVNFFAEST